MALTLPFTRKKPDAIAEVVVAAPSDLQVPASDFDFTEGAFPRAERTRRILLGFTSAALIGVVLVGGAGIRAATQAQDAVAATAAFDQQTQADTARIAQLDTAGGYSSAQLRAHNDPREAQKQVAESTQAANTRLISAVYAAAPAGMEVQTVSVAWSSGDPFAPANPDGTGADPAGTDPGTTPPAGAAAPATTSPSLSVTAKATNFSQIAVFSDNLAQIPGLVSPSPTWTGGGDSWTVSVSAGLDAAARGETR